MLSYAHEMRIAETTLSDRKHTWGSITLTINYLETVKFKQ